MFHESEGFCVRCGECRDGRPTAAQRRVQSNIGKTFFLLGLLAIGAAVAVSQIRLNGAYGSMWIKPWYDETYSSAGKTLLKGDDYVSWAEMGGSGLCGIGLLAMLVARINAGRRKAR